MTKKSETTETKSGTFERIRLWSEDKMIEYELGLYRKLFGQLEIFSNELKNEGITLDSEIFQSFITEGYPAISKILIREAEKSLKKMKISSTLVRESISSDARRLALPFDKFSIPLKKLIYECHIPPTEVKIENGLAVFAPGQEDAIREKWTCYLKDIQEKEIYDSLQAWVNVTRELDTFLKEKGCLPRLGDCLISALTENPFIPGDPGVPAELNPERYLMIDGEDNIIINPKYFNP